MRFDPHIRSYNDTPPLFYAANMSPGTKVAGSFVRFRWPEPLDSDVQRIRERVQEAGRGLFVLRDPFDDTLKYLVEGAYPEDVSGQYHSTMLDPGRQSDRSMGRLIVWNDLGPDRTPRCWRDDLHPLSIDRIRAGNRNARKDLKRQGTPSYHKLDLRDEVEKEGEEVIQEWSAMYADAWIETFGRCARPSSAARGAGRSRALTA